MVRTDQYLYVRNFTPERWPAGTPSKFANVKYDAAANPVSSKLGPEHGGYHDIDACPTLSFMIAQRANTTVSHLFQLAVAKRPAEELYDISQDAGCLQNLAGNSKYAPQLQRHRELLVAELSRTGDLRQTDFAASSVWETYPRYSSLRWFPKPAWAEQDNVSVPEQEWLEARRPRE